MSEDFEIELQEAESEGTEETQLPMNFLLFGTVENDDTKVYIKQDVYKALEDYARVDTQHERGTILLGHACEELGKTNVIITNYIEARYTDASASTLTFTHETWDYVHREHDSKYPDKKIIGWQHTHPSYGIFLSNYDIFIHENFFNLPFQIAYVIDPIQDLRGFFQWKNGKIEKLNGYYVFDEVGKPIKISQKQSMTPAEQTSNNRTHKKFTASILLVLLLALAGIFISLSARRTITLLRSELAKQTDQQAELERIIQQNNNDILILRNSVNADKTDNNSELEFTVSELSLKIEDQQVVIDNQQQIIEQLQTEIERIQSVNETDDDDEEWITHVVKLGDTLGSICSTYGINYLRNRDTILEINHINDENIIFVGEELIFPKSLAAKE